MNSYIEFKNNALSNINFVEFLLSERKRRDEERRLAAEKMIAELDSSLEKLQSKIIESFGEKSALEIAKLATEISELLEKENQYSDQNIVIAQDLISRSRSVLGQEVKNPEPPKKVKSQTPNVGNILLDDKSSEDASSESKIWKGDSSTVVLGCSHRYRNNPVDPDEIFSEVIFSLDFPAIEQSIGLKNTQTKSQWLDVVGTIYMKDGTPVQVNGSVSYSKKDGVYQSGQNWVTLVMDKKKEIKGLFGGYPKVDCKVVGLESANANNIRKDDSPGVVGCSHEFKNFVKARDSQGNVTEEDVFSYIVFGINFAKVANLLNLEVSDGQKQELDVVGTLFSKSGREVERVGTVRYKKEEGVFGTLNRFTHVKVDKEEFITEFGYFPELKCEIAKLR